MTKFSKWLRGKAFNWLGVEPYVKKEIDTAIEKIRQDLTIGFDYGYDSRLSGISSCYDSYPRNNESIKNVVQMILDHLQLKLKYKDGTESKVYLERSTQSITTFLSEEHAREFIKKRVNPKTKKSKKG